MRKQLLFRPFLHMFCVIGEYIKKQRKICGPLLSLGCREVLKPRICAINQEKGGR
jgi:hypothetical protein